MYPSRTRTLLAILGTRPEAIKMAPVLRELAARPGHRVVLVSTGQHAGMLGDALAAFGLRPDHDLGLMTPGAGLGTMLSKMLAALEPVLAAEAPELVLVHGDTISALAGGLSCFYLGIPFAHVEAGLRSHRIDSPFPEEFHRLTLARAAALHLAPTPEARDALLAEGASPGAIAVTGSTAVDALELVRAGAGPAPVELDGLRPDQDLVVVTLHRRETGPERRAGILGALAAVARRRPELRFLYPVHPAPDWRQLAMRTLGDVPNVRLTLPLPYPAFVAALARCRAIVTDSGGIQEEATHLGRPVLLVRDATERPEAVASGWVRVAGTDPAALGPAFEELLAAPRPAGPSPFGAGFASRAIADAIEAYLGPAQREAARAHA